MYTVGPPAVKHLNYRYIIEEEHIFLKNFILKVQFNQSFAQPVNICFF